MLRRSLAGILGLLVMTSLAWAADKDVKGTIVKVDKDKKMVTISTDDGKKDFLVGTSTKIMDDKGKVVKEGLADSRIKVGEEVTIVLATATSKTMKEMHLAKAEAVKDTTKDTKSTKTETASGKKPTTDDSKKGIREAKTEIKGGIKGKLTKIDADKNMFSLTTDDGKKMDFTLSDKTEFIGPRGGKSKDGMKDDRFVVGAEVTVVAASGGKAASEVHLPYRKKEDSNKK